MKIWQPELITEELVRNTEILPPPKGNRGGNKRRYKNAVCAFDIETTRIVEIEQSVMYMWQFQYDVNIPAVIGRTWDEFLEMLERMAEGMKDNEWIVIYVHNLSFEFQFLSGVYPFQPEEVFAVESRRVLKCDMYNHFEFRCSYLHSNMSLAKFLENMGVEHEKLSGEKFDYTKQRYWFTELTDYELQYGINDVRGLAEAIKIEMYKDGDDLYSVPLTSTGYVRRDVKTALKRLNYKWFRSLYPDLRLYKMLREAFRGGNTHANRYFSGQILTGVRSMDRSSSYPETQCNLEFPVTPFQIVEPAPDIDKVIYNIKVRHKAVVMRVAIRGLSLIDKFWGCPYLSKDKCRQLSKDSKYDNGRILETEYLECTITDIDLLIILSEYNFDVIEVIDYAHATYGKLPDELTSVIRMYYTKKTELKGIEGEEYYYMKSKNKLNSVYGMSAQDPVKEDIVYTSGAFELEKLSDNDAESLLTKKRATMPYQWGVWCTAHARKELEEGIRLAHGERSYFLYCDTDSVKYVGEIDMEEYNNGKISQSTASGAYATDKHGVTHYMGVYEDDGEYFRFKTLGAKKYCYTDVIRGEGFLMEGDLHLTLAGVPKRKGAQELVDAGGIEKFSEGFLFRADKLESQYNDAPPMRTYTVEGREIPITKNINLKPTTYLLDITDEYREILDDVRVYRSARKVLTEG